MPGNIDMTAIREAMNRRLSGQQPGPMLNQMSREVAPSGFGGSATPTPRMPTIPTQSGEPRPLSRPPQAPQKPQQGQQGSNFDDDTRVTAKALIAKLMKVI